RSSSLTRAGSRAALPPNARRHRDPDGHTTRLPGHGVAVLFLIPLLASDDRSHPFHRPHLHSGSPAMSGLIGPWGSPRSVFGDERAAPPLRPTPIQAARGRG